MSDRALLPLDREKYRELVRCALQEDVGTGDVTTGGAVPAGLRARARLVAKSACVVAGLDVAAEVFRQLDPDMHVTPRVRDGDSCAAGSILAEYGGSAAALLTGERTALNFMQRMSGIATLTRAFVDAAGGRIVVLDTRKTTPLLRALEKYAVRAGGGTNHRRGLDDAILIKDNHIELAGGVTQAVGRVRAAHPGLPLEIEAQSLDQVDAALAAGADTVLLDNLADAELAEAVRRCRGRAQTEVSGGVTLARMAGLAKCGADFVSVGALTHSAPAADLSFDIAPA